ncbi:MAG: hypothetical protein HEP70_16950 [Rhodobiaceae bacterium]|jgi:hypothetical protein|nr:hypothetical protein [Rhodobiaceae bacterium]
MSNKPTHTAFQVTKAGDKNFWNRIGAAWENKDGNGFNIKLFAMPLDGEIVIRVAKDNADEEQD